MAYTNSQILSAVLSHWAQPLIGQIISNKVSTTMPFLSNLESKIRASGWVSPSWKIGSELSPLLGGMSERVLNPIIQSYAKKLPEESIPDIAHSIVDNAIEKGSLELLEGKISFEMDDLESLKRLLDKNLPLQHRESYEVRE